MKTLCLHCAIRETIAEYFEADDGRSIIALTDALDAVSKVVGELLAESPEDESMERTRVLGRFVGDIIKETNEVLESGMQPEVFRPH